jgi:hypothetical protein
MCFSWWCWSYIRQGHLMRRHSSGRLFARNCSCWQACGRDGCTTILYAQGTHPAAIQLRRSGVLYRSPSCAHAHRHARVCVCARARMDINVRTQTDMSVNVCATRAQARPQRERACESLGKSINYFACKLRTPHARATLNPPTSSTHT